MQPNRFGQPLAAWRSAGAESDVHHTEQILQTCLQVMISALRAGDYQHEAEEVVSIKCKGLSVFGLHRLSRSQF
jgi:hypothetical protein